MNDRIFVMTDTHGELEKLKSLFDQVNFDFEQDQLIHLGDCIDRGPDSAGVIDLLLKVKNLIAIRGNHDAWMLDFMNTGVHPGPAYVRETALSYLKHGNPGFRPEFLPQSHKDFFRAQIDYYIDKQNRCFCHAGFDTLKRIQDQDSSDFYWNRELINKAMSARAAQTTLEDVNNFKQVFIGHTPTINWEENGQKITRPIYAAQVINLDTGGVYGYHLSMIDITTDQHVLYQSL